MNINKDLDNIITIRVNKDLTELATKAADSNHITLSQFIRQSIIRNINIYCDVEKQVKEQAQRLHKGLSQ